MPPIPPLFTVSMVPNGTITCTQPSPKIYLLLFDLPPDNRHTPEFCAAFLLALDIVDYRYPRGIVITTSAISKFYSNGLDYESAIKSKDFFSHSLYPLWRRILTYPMPTLALVNGHAFAAGLMTAMMHDYRIMNPHRGYLCLNELDFGAPLQPPMASIFRQKLTSPGTYRTLVLEVKRINALEALKEGIVDGLGDADEAILFAKEMGLLNKAKSGVYGRLKGEMWRETVRFLDDAEDNEITVKREVEKEKRRELEQRKRVEDWEGEGAHNKAKL